MTTTLSDDEYQRQVTGYARSAFRLELQPAYSVGYERELFDAFLAGSPEPPTTRERFRAWYDQIARQVAAGIRTERVRLVDEPPTDYQRWTRYMDQWNLRAGEAIHYLQRRRADDIGLTRAFEGHDWWLLDDARLIVMFYDPEGRRSLTTLVTDDHELRQARSWRDTAIRTAKGDTA